MKKSKCENKYPYNYFKCILICKTFKAHEVQIKNNMMDEKKQIWESLGFP